MGFRFWFGRTVVFSAGSFIPTSLAAVARIGFRTRGQQSGSGFYAGGGCFSMGIPLPGLLGNRGLNRFRPQKKQGSYFEPDFRPETPPFFESTFSFNA